MVEKGERDNLSTNLKRVSKHSLYFVIADLAKGGALFLVTLIYAASLSPSEFGVLALASVTSSLLVMILSFGGANVVQRFYHQFTDPSERSAFLGSFWMFLIVVPGLVIALLLSFGGLLVDALLPSLSIHPAYELVMINAYLIVAFGTVPPSLFRAREQPGRYLTFTVSVSLLTVGLAAYVCLYLQPGILGALSAQLATSALMSLAAAGMFLREFALRLRPAAVRTALAYGLPLVPHFGAHWVLNVSDRLLLERLAGLASVGVYTLAYQFGTLLQMLFSAANSAIMPSFSRASTDKSEFALLGRLATYFFLFVAVSGTMVALTAGDVITLLAPHAYYGATTLVPYIVLGIVAFGFYLVPMNALSFTAGRTRVVPIITLISGATNICLNILLIPFFGTLAAAITTAISYALLAMLVTIYAQRVVPLRYETLRIVKIGFASLLIYTAGIGMNFNSPLADLSLRLLLVGITPLVLWLIGFWTEEERCGLARLLRIRHAQFGTISPPD